MAPRAYLIAPTGANAIDLQYSYLDGSVQFDGAAPITGATATTNVGTLSYYHGFGFFGRAANTALGVPYGSGDFKGTVFDAPKEAKHSRGFFG